MNQIEKIIGLINEITKRFKESRSEGNYLSSEDEARYKGLVLQAKDILDEKFGPRSFYPLNIIQKLNADDAGVIGGPSPHGLSEMIETLRAASIKFDRIESNESETLHEKKSDVVSVTNLCRKLHGFSRSLKHRHSNRNTIIIDDEYDVQDLLRALLGLEFTDIREEEYSPSYAGGSSRIDFVLKKENIVVETKMARQTLTDKKIGEELIIDIAKYKNHPNCKIMVCFIYDPDSHIRNPFGLAADIEKLSSTELPIFVVISP